MKYLGPIIDSKDIVNKEYVDVLASKLDIVAMMAAEASFVSKVNSKVQQYEFDYYCIELFDTSSDIDTTLEDGSYVVTNFFVGDRHLINKTSTDTRTILSRKFEVDSIPYRIWIYADYDGAGSIDLYVSKNNGTDWTAVTNDTEVELNALVQKDIRVKVVMNGVVRLKNIAWGIS